MSPFIYSICRASVTAVLLVANAAVSQAGVGLASPLRNIDPYRHIEALQDIATANEGNRAAGTPGYEQSAEYIAGRLRSAGYTVRFEELTFPYFEEQFPPVLQARFTRPDRFAPPQEALRTLRNSGSGDVTAPVQPVDLSLGHEPLQPSTSGCEREDFEGFVPGHIALVRRGTCPFQAKVEHAQAAGAAGVIIMNQGTEGQTGIFAARLTKPVPFPVLGVTTEVGRRLAAVSQDPEGAEIRLKIETEAGTRSVRNVIADRDVAHGPFIVVGAHLDSVPEGPGMNDNASGSAAVLEMALQLARESATDVPIRFAFWGAEERGLLGSRYHLDSLPEEERRRIALYINLDMVGSPNFGRFIQLTGGTKGALVTSTVAALTGYFGERDLPVEERIGRPRGFSSDDAAFAARDIPTISLFTGAGGTKDASQAQRFGGSAGQPFDPCYHKACDTALNVNRQVLEQITGAIVHALGQIAIP